MNTEKRNATVQLGLVLALAGAVRLFQLGERVVWFDESLSVLFARARVADIVQVAQADAHPPLYHLLLHFWLRLLPGESGQRLLSVLAGVAAVAGVFALAQRLTGAKAAVWSAVFLALAPLHVWYSQELRMYAVQTLFVSLSWLFMLRLLDRRSWFDAGGYAVVTALSLYTQYTSGFAVLAQNLFVLTAWRQLRESRRHWLAAQLATAVLFGPGLVLLRTALQHDTFGFWMSPFSWLDPIRFFALLSAAVLKNAGSYWPAIILTFAAGGGLAAVLLERKDTRRAAVLSLLWLLVPVALLTVLSLRRNIFLPRTLVFVTPAFALLVGSAAAKAAESRWKILVNVGVGLLLAGNLVALHFYFRHDNARLAAWIRSPARTISRQIAAGWQAGDLVVHSSRFSYRPFQCYTGCAQTMTDSRVEPPAVVKIIGDGRRPAEGAACRRVWLVVQPDFQQPGAHLRLLEWMDAHHTRVAVIHAAPDYFAALYERRDTVLLPR